MRLLSACTPLLVTVIACDAMPERVRVTPELRGRLTRSGAPVADASVLVVRRPEMESRRSACGKKVGSARTDSTGSFRARAHRSWIDKSELLDAGEPEQFQLCVRPAGDADYQLLFRAAANRWDTLEVECDLAQSWLAADRHGSAGRCVVARAAVDSQRLTQRTTRSPALACDTTTTLIEPLRIGPIRVNGSVTELKRLCAGLRDTTLREESLLGTTTELAHVLQISGAPVVIRKSSGVIHSLVVTSPVFRSREGFGVGSRVTQLLEKPDLRVVVASPHHGPYVFAWHGRDCGLAYSLSRPTYAMRDRVGVPIPLHRLRAWPATTKIQRVFVGFCPEHQFPELVR